MKILKLSEFRIVMCFKTLVLFLLAFSCSIAQANELDKAQGLFDSGKYDQSIYYYLKHIKYNPSDLESKVALSQAYIKTHKYDKAINKLDEVTAVIMSHENAITLRAHALAVQKQWTRLLLDADSLVQIDPLNKQAYMYMDMAYVGLGDQQSAAESMARYEVVSTQSN